VAPGGPADIAGLRTGDRITHIDGASILASEGARRFGAVKPGQRVRITVTRGGNPITREFILADRPRPIAGRSSLRYTGRLRDVDVEVWSPAGATVKREGDTMTINVGGSTILLKAK
jgi:predicted metalloprotease with PDZ domain